MWSSSLRGTTAKAKLLVLIPSSDNVSSDVDNVAAAGVVKK
jgi:hypothetical protein